MWSYILVMILHCITMSMSKVLQIRITSSQDNILKEVADKNQRKPSDMARIILFNNLKKNRRKN